MPKQPEFVGAGGEDRRRKYADMRIKNLSCDYSSFFDKHKN